MGIGMNFKDVAHKTVAELFDMLKAKVAAIQEMDEVIKLQDADLRKYEKQIESLREQLNNMEACYIQVKKERDELHAVLKCVSEHFVMNDLDGCMPRVFEMIQEALRGEQPKTKCGNLFCNEPSTELLCPKCKRNIRGEHV